MIGFLAELRRKILGDPLHNERAEHEKLPVWKALPVFSSDAISSVAYATEEILLVLLPISLAALHWSVPIAIVIGVLLLVVSASYRQTISLYPEGGGAYQVARENLGVMPSLVAGAALLIDYILTVSVSISAGVAAISSAFPSLGDHAIILSILFISLMMMANLRGLRESGLIFSIPTYFFIFMTVLLLGVGFYRIYFGEIEVVTKDVIHGTYPMIGLFLLARAFSSGCTALTGIEAISNGVPAFKKPSAVNAKTTMTLMILILGTFFLGITALAHHFGVYPVENETVLSQIARRVFNGGPLYYMIQAATTVILLLAANTAFADFPRLASLLASDRYLPRQLANIGDRLVFSNGIVVLGVSAMALVILFNADTHSLIPLYSVGVFISFTLSQSGMVIHHLKIREKHWQWGLSLNVIGALCTFVVMIIVAVTKFTHGAWMVLILIPAMIYAFIAIKRHYIHVGKQLVVDPKSLVHVKPLPSIAVIPISGFHVGVIKALRYAQSISSDIRVVVVDVNPITTKNLRELWDKYIAQESEAQKFVVLESPYRSVVTPIVEYLDDVQQHNPGRAITVVIPEFVTRQWWANFLHNQTAFFLKTRLRFIPGRVVVSINYHLN